MRPAHRRAAPQRAWIIFAGRADHAWQRWLRPGFRHCFAAIEDARGWMVLEALTGRLLLARLDVPSGFDAPAFYRRAGMVPVGPFPLDETSLGPAPGWRPLTCVSVCQAVLGPHAPGALTPYGLYRGLLARAENRKKCLTCG